MANHIFAEVSPPTNTSDLITLLVVDDNPNIRDLLKLTFDSNKYRVVEAEDGHEALKLVVSEKPDIVLLDVMMPGDIDGLAVCDFIKSSTLKQARVILLTAKGQEHDYTLGLAAGADEYVIKPFSPLALMELVENLLQR